VLIVRAVAGVALFVLISGVALYVAGLSDRLHGPGVYNWALKRNPRATDEMVERFDRRFYRSSARLCLVGRWMAATGLLVFLGAYVVESVF
jgi:hypothetical protein